MKCFLEWEPGTVAKISNKAGLLAWVSAYISRKGVAADGDRVVKVLEDREHAGDTRLAAGFVNPHAQDAVVNSTTLLFVKLLRPLTDWRPGDRVDRFLFTLLPERVAFDEATRIKAFYRLIANEDVMETLRVGDRETIQSILPTERE
jgi:mannitol/fructose-specific phosphotransferase system IIA component (Ntr-type)